MRFRQNLNTLDRVLRFSVGVGCIYLGFFAGTLIPSHLVAVLIGLFGVINLFACFTSHCPVYSACGFSTCTKEINEAPNESTR